MAGQPKTTAEYIQATSRVGRKHPGLVCTVFNWARPRDLSHYETFEHYHATFYKHVEALSVTPFSAGATARGLAALLVSLVRQPGFEFNSNDKAMLMATQRGHQYVKDAIEAITRRAELIAGVEAAEEVRQQLKRKMDLWQKRAQRTAQGSQLGYETKKDGVTIGLLRKPSIEPWDEFTCLNSLRDVEPTANLILDDFGLDDDGDDEPKKEPPHEQQRLRNAARSANCGPARCSRRSASARSSTCRTCRSWSWAWRTGRSRTPWRSASSGSWPR